MPPSKRSRPSAFSLSLSLLVLFVTFCLCHADASDAASTDSDNSTVTEDILPARDLFSWEIPCAARVQHVTEQDLKSTGGGTMSKGQVYESVGTQSYQTNAQWRDQYERVKEERAKNPNWYKTFPKRRYRLIHMPLQPFFTNGNEFLSKFLADEQPSLWLKDECVQGRKDTYRMVQDVQTWVSQVVGEDSQLWYPVIMGLVDVLQLDTKPEKYIQYMMGRFPSELKERRLRNDRAETTDDKEEEGGQTSFAAPESDQQLEWAKDPMEKDKLFVKINLRRLEKGIAVFHYLVRRLPVDAKKELDPSRIQELVDKTTLLREQVRAVLTCEGVHHVTPMEIESKHCLDPQPEVELKDIHDDDKWWDLHIGYEVSDRFHSLFSAFGVHLPFEWKVEMSMKMMDTEYPLSKCPPRQMKKLKQARERKRQRLAEGFSLSPSSLPSSMSSVFPPAREPFKWKREMISWLSFDVSQVSRACHYGASSKRAAILF